MDAGHKVQATKARHKRSTAVRGEGTAVIKPNRISSAEMVLDAAVEFTFPASDPLSIDHAFRAASRGERNSQDTHEAETRKKDFRASAPRRKIKRPKGTAVPE